MNPITQSIEAILFTTSEPVSIDTLAAKLETSKESIAESLVELKQSLLGHGIIILEQNELVTLATHPDQSALIESIRKDELTKELSKASAETLAIIAYTPGVSKAQIEFIRGVNASYSLRSLAIRGLIESKSEGRAVSYYPTIELLQSFGVSSIENLPAYAETKNKIDNLMKEPQ